MGCVCVADRQVALCPWLVLLASLPCGTSQKSTMPMLGHGLVPLVMASTNVLQSCHLTGALQARGQASRILACTVADNSQCKEALLPHLAPKPNAAPQLQGRVETGLTTALQQAMAAPSSGVLEITAVCLHDLSHHQGGTSVRLSGSLNRPMQWRSQCRCWRA